MVSSSLLLLSFLSTTFAANDKSQWEQGTITIPTSTVISIGLGFLAFSLFILLFLLSFRVNRIRKLAKRQNKSFKRCWKDEGGLWSFFTSFGEGDGHAASSALIGATGRGLDYNRQLYRIYRELEGDSDNIKAKEIPKMWDCSWNEKVDEDQDSGDDKIQPLSVTPSSPPPSDTSKTYPPLPILDMCVLISFPSESTDQEDLDLPQLIIGTTTLLPTIKIPDKVKPQSDFGLSSSIVRTSEKEGLQVGQITKKVVIEHIEYSRMRAEWKKDDSKGVWYIDGLRSE
ncbi:hypothetical protein V865_000778 [Kwoniella europaea PYCC6329]|uniref:Uncharacterized protein n=1 Tax=Kwoniella europaea PYCC6329 TaxID=1423913 RepID=A0AAX4K8D2_9TREE